MSGVPADKPEAFISSVPTRRRSDTRRKARKILTSAVEDVAELYGMPVSDIARIVSTISRLMP